MNYHLISDTHFNHLKLEEWGGRSGDWQQKLWDSLKRIPATDTLIHLGDICIGGDDEVLKAIKALPCKKILVRGNHDGKSNQTYMERAFDFSCDGIEMIYEGHYLHLTHRPARPCGNNTFNIHGHTHGNMHRSEEYNDFYSKEYHIDISPELTGFQAIPLKGLLKKVAHTLKA